MRPQQATTAPSPSAAGELTRLLRSTAFAFSLGCALAIYLGWQVVPLARYLTPERGVGYALGVAGGGSMLALLVYPARKRLRWLEWIGSVKTWFRIHMILGVVGPILVLYHANFSLGATNSNVALACMLLVAGSGLIGRYIYTKIHEGLYGHATTLGELQARAQRLQQTSSTVPMLAGLIERLPSEELHMQSSAGRHFALTVPLYAALLSYRARWRLGRYLRKAARDVEPAHRARQLAMARAYMRTRIEAVRRVSEHQAYVRLFSWWHILHLPLFLLLLMAGVVHVIAVHVY